jgi:hypothetical protein
MSYVPAICMLERLGLDTALIGDLLEECGQGRSAIWFWKQVLIAVWTGIWRAILGHKLLALRAIATGCAVNGVGLFLWEKFLPIGLSTYPSFSMESIASLLLILLSQAATGWVIARTHRAHPVPMALVFAIWLSLWSLVSEFSRIHMLSVKSTTEPLSVLAWRLEPVFIVAFGILAGAIAGAPVPAGSHLPLRTNSA